MSTVTRSSTTSTTSGRPRRRRPRATCSTQLVLASHLLGANRAVSNFGGGNTSAKGTATDHAGREVEVMWVKGSGSRPRHDGAGALHRRCGSTRCCRCSSATR